MKILKFGIRIWITIASVASFVMGWVMLVHAPKPYQAPKQLASETLQTLDPLPPLSDFGPGDNNFQNQPLFSIQQQQPRMGFNSFFRTGGS
jgi:hypothetical protein